MTSVKSSLRRIASWTLFAALAGIAVLGAPAWQILGPADLAAAAGAQCSNTYLATSGRELFAVDTTNVPPPLRAFPWDCASRLAADGSDAPEALRAYVLAYTDADVATVVGILRAFEQAGWIVGPSIGAIDVGPGPRVDGVALTADDLAAVETTPQYVRARFGDESTGLDTIELTYADGAEYTNDASLATPSIFVTVATSRLFPASGLADPSVLSSLRTIAQAAPSPTQLAVVCSASVILMLVVGYPASLLNSVIGGRYDRVAKWMRSTLRRGTARPAKGEPARKARSTSWLVWPGFAVAGIIAGFVDPGFGPNLMSLRVLLTGFLSFALFNLVGWIIVRRVVRRLEPDAGPYIKFRWGSLLILLVAVLIGRLLEFSPGVIFGLVSGLAFAVTLTASRKAIVVLVGSGYALAVSLVGWIAYSILAPLAVPGDAAMVAVVEFLSGVTLEGIATLPLALLPLAALDGADLIAWKKWVWGLSYAVGLAAFSLVLFTIPDSFASYTGDFLAWSLLFAGFAIGAVVIWWIDAVANRRAEKKQGEAAPA